MVAAVGTSATSLTICRMSVFGSTPDMEITLPPPFRSIGRALEKSGLLTAQDVVELLECGEADLATKPDPSAAGARVVLDTVRRLEGADLGARLVRFRSGYRKFRPPVETQHRYRRMP